MTRYTTITAGGQLVGIKRPTSSTDNVTITYDANKRVHTLIRDGQTWTYAWSLSGTTLTATATDPLLHNEVTTTDTSKLVLLTDQDGDGHITTYQYDAQGRPIYVILPEGTISGGTPTAGYTKLTYDGRGNITEKRQVAKSGLSAPDIVESAVYPASCTNLLICNEPTSITDAKANATNYTYDPTTGLATSITQPAVTGGSATMTLSYTPMQAYYKNSSGTIAASGAPVYLLTSTSICQSATTCAGTANEIKTIIGFGPQATGTGNNLLPVNASSGAGDGSLTATTSATYDTIGNALTTTDALGNVTRYRYDAGRELVGIVTADPDGASALHNRAKRVTYSADGQVTLMENGYVTSQSDADWANFVNLNQLATVYDAADRKVQDAVQEGTSTLSVTHYSYDAASRLDCTAVRMNPAAYSSAPNACTQSTVGSFGPDRISENHYDAAGKIASVTSGVGTPLLRTEASFGYNPNGTTASLADAKGNVTSYGYDGFDRLTTTNYPKPGGGDFEQLVYDANGNVTSRRLRDGNSVSYGYDALNRRTSMTLPATGPVSDSSVTYSYDLLGHLLQANDTNSHFAHYTYDALGRQITEASPWGTKTSQYDLNGNRKRLTWPDGFFVNYFYNALNQMVGIQENSGTFLASFDYDDLGRRIKRHLANDDSDIIYSYVGASRLGSLTLGGTNPTTVTLGNYSPASEIGSRANSNDAYAWTQGVNVNRAYSANSLNQYSSIAGSALGYDARGNLTSSGGISYIYNSKNQLASSGTSNYYYDPLGRLDQSAGEGLSFDYDGQHMISEVNSSNQIARRYIFGPDGDEPIVWYEGSGTTDKRYLDHDERGSITRITDSTGAVIAINSYDEYGIPASTNQGRFQYTGQAWLPGISMYYYKARMYSPTLGRFMQTDPIGYGDGPNWYNYVHSNPVNGIDILGLQDGPDIVVRVPITGPTLHWYTLQGGVYQMATGRIVPNYFGDPVRKATPQNTQGAEIVVQARYLRRAVITALNSACGCSVDPSNFLPLSPNFVQVIDPNKLPKIFRGSLSAHAKASSTAIPNSNFVLKFYSGDTDNGGLSTLTITTPLTDPEHYIDFLFSYSFGDPINSYYARQYCLNSGHCG